VPEVYDVPMKIGVTENVISTLTGISNMMKGISAETRVSRNISRQSWGQPPKLWCYW
jgi:hypothetical protein